MTPDEVIEQLSLIGAQLSRTTLVRYEKQALIPYPERGSLGRAGGRWTDYPDSTVSEAFAAWVMMRGEYGFSELNHEIFEGKPPRIPPTAIAVARRMAHEIELTMSQEQKYSPQFFSDILRRDVPKEEDARNWAFDAADDVDGLEEAALDACRAMHSTFGNFLVTLWLWEVIKADVRWKKSRKR